MNKQREMFEAWAKSEYQNHSEMYFEWCDEYDHYVLDEVDFAFEAWKAAIGSNSNHFVDLNDMVRFQPVARIKTVGGYPDDSCHEVDFLVKYKELSDGQTLYAINKEEKKQNDPI